MNKRELGQYYTIQNPFKHLLFKKWMNLIPVKNKIIEPFAGSNNIVKLVKESGYNYVWDCFDIEPPNDNVTPEYTVKQKDTLKDFPIGYNVCITNPPYLGKSSAKRRKINYPWEEDDLYKVCLSVMLKHCDYVAAIIPESFITADIHTDRLFGVVSLNCNMFDDTDCPVCLAMFVPYKVDNTEMWTTEEYLGTLQELKNYPLTACTKGNMWVFNDKNGSIGVKTVDSQIKPDCEFFYGEKINPENIKVSSRAFTRISGLPKNYNLNEFLNECNIILKKYRYDTKDVLMTSFKGLRKDGKYRRRLDFRTVRCILNRALKTIEDRKTCNTN